VSGTRDGVVVVVGCLGASGCSGVGGVGLGAGGSAVGGSNGRGWRWWWWWSVKWLAGRRAALLHAPTAHLILLYPDRLGHLINHPPSHPTTQQPTQPPPTTRQGGLFRVFGHQVRVHGAQLRGRVGRRRLDGAVGQMLWPVLLPKPLLLLLLLWLCMSCCLVVD